MSDKDKMNHLALSPSENRKERYQAQHSGSWVAVTSLSAPGLHPWTGPQSRGSPNYGASVSAGG